MDSTIVARSHIPLRRFPLLVLFLWSGAVALLLRYNLYRVETQALESVRIYARTVFEKDVTYYIENHPALMPRLVSEFRQLEFGTTGKITSSKSLREDNAPDEWEAAALKILENGEANEVSSLETLRNIPYLRLPQPLYARATCFSCHAAHGRTEGNVLGAVSVAVPLESHDASIQHSQMLICATHICLWLFGVVGMGWDGACFV